jgi:acyl carrier protein
VSDQKLEEIVRATLAQIAPEAFNEQLDIDSMDFLNFVIALDEATGVEIPERDYAQLGTLDGCVRYLEAHANTDAR